MTVSQQKQQEQDPKRGKCGDRGHKKTGKQKGRQRKMDYKNRKDQKRSAKICGRSRK